MSLTAALRTASSALALNSAQSAIVARNISGAGDASYARRLGAAVTLGDGAAQLGRVERAADPALRATLLAATAAASASTGQADGLTRLAETVGDTTDEASPASRLAAFGAALQFYAATPSDASAGRAAVTAAGTLAGSLNNARAAVQVVREDADAKMAAAVATINALLADFDKADAAVVAGTRAGADVADALDARDATLTKLADEIGITTVNRPDGGLAIYTDGGVTLADGGARTVTMRASTALPAGTEGAAVVVDGVAVTGVNAPMPIRAGVLAGLAGLRDAIAPQYGAQLDGMAAALVNAFAEQDRSGAGGPSRPGLFTWDGAPALPSVGAPGAARSIALAAAVDPARGGDVSLLRDGGIFGPTTAVNTTGAASDSERLRYLVDQVDAPRAFDAGAGLGVNASLSGYASASVGWIAAQRGTATNTSDANTALATQAAQALSNKTGVSIDDQMAHMLALENAYQASAKLLTAANAMFQSLFAAIGA